MWRLQYSGFDQKFRTEAVWCAMHACDRLMHLDANGWKPLYKPREWRRLEKGTGKTNKMWNLIQKRVVQHRHFCTRNTRVTAETKVYEGNATLSSWHVTLYRRGLPATNDDDMIEFKDTGLKIKVVEQWGVTLKRMLQKSDLFKEKKCRIIACLICKAGGKRSCRSTGVTYELVCQVCRHKYVAETTISAYTWGMEPTCSRTKGEESSYQETFNWQTWRCYSRLFQSWMLQGDLVTMRGWDRSQYQSW